MYQEIHSRIYCWFQKGYWSMCYGKQGEFVLWKKSGILGYQILEYLAMINTSIMAPSTCISISSLFKKYASTRSIFKSFSPVHTTEKAETMEIREHPFRSMRHARSIWCMTSTYLKISIFVCPHVNEEPAFSKTLLWRVFLKRCVFGDCFHWIRVDGLGQTGDKNPHFQTKTDMCVDAWGYVLQQWIGFNWHATVICLKCLDNIVNWILTSQSGLKLSDTN